MKDKEYITPSEVASLLIVSPVTVRQWSQKGLLAFEQTPGGHRRYHYSTIEDFARKRGLHLHNRQSQALRILIVDDDPLICLYLTELLQTISSDIKTDTAKNGFEAGQKVQAFQPDILLLDLFMPDLDGFQTCQHIKQNPETNSIRIIAMTGHPSAENITRIINVGAESCLSKPIDEEELISALKHETLQISL